MFLKAQLESVVSILCSPGLLNPHRDNYYVMLDTECKGCPRLILPPIWPSCIIGAVEGLCTSLNKLLRAERDKKQPNTPHNSLSLFCQLLYRMCDATALCSGLGEPLRDLCLSLFPVPPHPELRLSCSVIYCPVNRREKSHENKKLYFGVGLGYSSLQMGFESPIGEPQHEVALPSTPHWGEE